MVNFFEWDADKYGLDVDRFGVWGASVVAETSSNDSTWTDPTTVSHVTQSTDGATYVRFFETS